MSLSKSDAAVSLKSFGRRFAEVTAGPAGDDSWERILKTNGPKKVSTLDILRQATADLRVLTNTIEILPSTELPKVSFPQAPTNSGTNSGTNSETIAEAVAAVKAASTAAGTAVSKQSSEGYSREVEFAGQPTTLRDLTTTVVNRCVQGLKDAQEAIDSAT